MIRPMSASNLNPTKILVTIKCGKLYKTTNNLNLNAGLKECTSITRAEINILKKICLKQMAIGKVQNKSAEQKCTMT